MSVVGDVRAARACSAWARPISPPSTVTAALFDMFCGLNGRTLRPRLGNARARPATISDLPTSDPGPWNMIARADNSELDTALRLHPGGKMVLDHGHFGHEVRRGNELRLGVAAGDDDMQIGSPPAQRGDHDGEIEILITQRDVELVEDEETERRIGHELGRLRPGALGGRDVALEILRLPGETLAHGVPGHLVAKASQRVAFGAVPSSLDELHHADAFSAPEHAKRKAECSGRFPLARAGMHDEKTLLDLLFRHFGILDRLALGHFCAMALAFGVIEDLGHAPPFTMSGSPATRKTTRSARAAMLWLS